jgi:hypothetical protein
VHQFITAMRQLRQPIVVLAVGVLVLQMLVAGLSMAHAAARLAAADADAIILCHGNDSGGRPGTGSGKAAHECCAFCTAAEPAALPAGSTPVLTRLAPVWQAELAALPDVRTIPRAIRAGPSQAPPIVA